MGGSDRAPAPPAIEGGSGQRRQGARHVSAIQQLRNRRDRHRYWQELVPRRGTRSAWRNRASAEMVAWPDRGATCQPATVPDRDGGLRGAHHLSRKLQLLGHNARLMPAKYVRPYSKGQKNDFRDAEAIAEAVQRPTMKFVATKTADQLDLQALHRVRDRLDWSVSVPASSIRSVHSRWNGALTEMTALRFDPTIVASQPSI